MSSVKENRWISPPTHYFVPRKVALSHFSMCNGISHPAVRLVLVLTAFLCHSAQHLEATSRNFPHIRQQHKMTLDRKALLLAILTWHGALLAMTPCYQRTLPGHQQINNFELLILSHCIQQAKLTIEKKKKRKKSQLYQENLLSSNLHFLSKMIKLLLPYFTTRLDKAPENVQKEGILS